LSRVRYKELILAALAALCAIEGTWKTDVHNSWPFLVVVFLAMTSLGMALFFDRSKGLLRVESGAGLRTRLAADLGHLGLLVVLFGGLLGASSYQEGKVLLYKDLPVDFAFSAVGEKVQLPFEMTLKEFSVEYYDDYLSPKQFTSVIYSDGRRFSTCVNHPCRIGGYSVYQFDYDKVDGAYSVVRLVRDPWIAVIWVGMALLAVAALLGIGCTWLKRRSQQVSQFFFWRKMGSLSIAILIVVLLAVVFGVITLASIRFGTLAPALRSFWFIPHILIYMLAYSFLAISLVFGVLSFPGLQRGSFENSQQIFRDKFSLSRKMLSTASSLLLLGMLCGAAWAKAAWGDCWTWDAKECWAATTWLLTLVGIHLPEGSKKSTFVIAVGLAFLAMQVTWYGVDYLPASIDSLHTY